MDSNQGGTVGQERPRTLLIGPNTNARDFIQTCPHATTLTAWDDEANCFLLVALTCKRWGCCVCGRRKCAQLAIRCELAAPTKFVTLSVNNKAWLGPREAYDGTRRKVSDLSKLLRKSHGEFEYMRVIESTRAGWPHYHLVARCEYIAQEHLSRTWAELTGATIVDIRKIQDRDGCYGYVMKYLAKQTYVPWTSRRVSWSAKFFPPKDKSQFKRQLLIKKRDNRHPADYVNQWLPEGVVLDRVTPTAWHVHNLQLEPFQLRKILNERALSQH